MTTGILTASMRRRSAKDWCVIALVGLAFSIEIDDAALGLNGLTSGSELAAGNVIDVADVMAGAAATWFLRG